MFLQNEMYSVENFVVDLQNHFFPIDPSYLFFKTRLSLAAPGLCRRAPAFVTGTSRVGLLCRRGREARTEGLLSLGSTAHSVREASTVAVRRLSCL